MRPQPLEIICYHCQQAGEKALKAVLAHHGEEIPRTHDLRLVPKLCAVHYPDMLNELSEPSRRLTDYASRTRYPDEIEVDESDLESALKNAAQILAYVTELMEKVQGNIENDEIQ